MCSVVDDEGWSPEIVGSEYVAENKQEFPSRLAELLAHIPMGLACLLAPHAECLYVNLYLLIVNIYFKIYIKNSKTIRYKQV